MIRGSFAVSLFLHIIILLIIGSIVIVPGAVQKLLPVASVPITPMDIPQPPKMEEAAPVDQSLDPGGSPISDQPQDAAPTPDAAKADALVMDTPVTTMGPRMDASSGASATIASDVFKQGGGETGNGTSSALRMGLGKATLFGNTEKNEDSLVGKIYDFKQSRDRKPLKIDDAEDLKEIVRSGFSAGAFSKYFSPKNVLYAAQLYIPSLNTYEGPKAFGAEKDMQADHFVVHYHGVIAPAKDMTFRFAGWGDSWLIIAIDKKIVLDGSLYTFHKHAGSDSRTLFSWTPPKESWEPSGLGQAYSDWMEWKAGDFKTIDILFCETNLGTTDYGLTINIQEKGQTYEKGHCGWILPLLRFADVKPENSRLMPYLEGGPIFKAKHSK